MNRTAYTLLATLLCSIAVVPSARAGQEPKRAVSNPNLAVAVQGGALNGTTGGIASATASAPLGNQFGLQIDGLYGRSDILYAGVGGHLFYRDPSKFLAGVTAMTSKTNKTEFNRYGVESEFYFDQFTFAPAGGLQDGDSRLGNSGFYDVSGSYYPNDKLKYTIGSTGFKDVVAGYGAAEWQPTEKPMALFVTAGGANEGNAFAMAGVRYTFGASADTTIKKRDRTGDPANIVKNALDYTGSAIQELSKVITAPSGNNG